MAIPQDSGISRLVQGRGVRANPPDNKGKGVRLALIPSLDDLDAQELRQEIIQERSKRTRPVGIF